ncbi:DNA polymerase Y family protein [Vibrio scophthalmi]|uniref:Y-family DNA polymerase n=1 Tax=Vibrio scophthalmi TaxID=45658 RepID=UPI002284DCC6|nr:DNA polymerase Y family protein [Vibrio scophthalmi]MCY9802022.1 DNA polymerase Y family protein [Vibrio scophthalmi]
MQLWLYLHFPTLQLDALFAEQNGQAMVIVDGQHFQIVQVNPVALELGIKAGMGLGSASALCHELQVHPYDAKQEQQTLVDIAQWLYLVTSDIVLLPPQGLLLKVTDMLCLYGGIEAYWQTLSRHLDKLGYRYDYSTGFSPYSAMLFAKSATMLICDDKEQLMATLQPFSLTCTELAEKQVTALQRVGVNTLADLLSLPMSELARRFDIDLVNYVGRLLGQFKHPLAFYHPPEKFHSYLELLYEIENIQWLERPLKKLLERLELFLTLRNHIAYELQLTLHQRDKQNETITFTSACGDAMAKHWLKLCQLTLESLKLTAPVQGLTLAIVRGGALEATSRDMFNGPQGQQSPLELVSLLQAKLGKEKVRKVALSQDPRPEKATQLCDPTQSTPPITHRNIARCRPSFLLPEPTPLQEKVSIIQGPERFVTGWWDGGDITRDYFIARSEQGRWLWVFRNQDKQWFLHGQFS